MLTNPEIIVALVGGFIGGFGVSNLFGLRRDMNREYNEFKRGYYLGHGGGTTPADNVPKTLTVDFGEVERRVLKELTKK